MAGPVLATRQADIDVGAPLLPDAVKQASISSHDIYHEIGPMLQDQTVKKVIPIDRTDPPLEVHVRSHVLTRSTRALRSPAYLATIRRRGAGKIARLVAELEKYADSDDFVAWTHQPLRQLRKLIQKLSDAEEYSDSEHEGNSCEILRQLRDTFLNSGWKRYRESGVRDTAVSILRHLAEANQDDVTGENASIAMDRLLDLNLDPAVGFVWDDAEKEKEEVSD